jgi:hypothetical protein
MPETKAKEILAEGLQKVEEVLADAKTLLNLSDRDVELLKQRSSLLESWADPIIDHFYEVLLRNEKAKKIVEENNISLEKLKKANKNWYRSIVSGKVDDEFFKHSFFVGLLHIYYGVDNDLMIFMADVLRRKFLELCLQNFDEEEAFAVYEAFSKIVAAFVGFTVEGYVFMLKKSLFDILGMKPALVSRMMKMELEAVMKEYFKDKRRECRD